jgi:hypothetical protein
MSASNWASVAVTGILRKVASTNRIKIVTRRRVLAASSIVADDEGAISDSERRDDTTSSSDEEDEDDDNMSSLDAASEGSSGEVDGRTGADIWNDADVNVAE